MIAPFSLTSPSAPKKARVRHDWTPQLLRDVARWVNRFGWKLTDFDGYRRSLKSRPEEAGQGMLMVCEAGCGL